MSLKIDTESEDYQKYKTLNEDVLLHQTSNEHWDITFENGDYVNVTGKNSLSNAIVIAILTRFQELKIPLYDGFGCRVHELVKDNDSEMNRFQMELFITDVLENMRRINEINEIIISDNGNRFNVYFNVTSINDEIVSGEVDI